MKMSYIEWARKLNENFDPSKELKLDVRTALRPLIVIDGIRGR